MTDDHKSRSAGGGGSSSSSTGTTLSGLVDRVRRHRILSGSSFSQSESLLAAQAGIDVNSHSKHYLKGGLSTVFAEGTDPTGARKEAVRKSSGPIRPSSPDVSLLQRDGSGSGSSAAITDSDSLSSVSEKNRRHASSLPHLPVRSDAASDKSTRKKKERKHQLGGDDSSPATGTSCSEERVSNAQIYDMLMKVSGDIERVNDNIAQYYRHSTGGVATGVKTAHHHDMPLALSSDSEEGEPFDFLYHFCCRCGC